MCCPLRLPPLNRWLRRRLHRQEVEAFEVPPTCWIWVEAEGEVEVGRSRQKLILKLIRSPLTT